MKCPVCGKEFSFFDTSGGGGVYCSAECAEKAEKELNELLKRMEEEENNHSGKE